MLLRFVKFEENFVDALLFSFLAINFILYHLIFKSLIGISLFKYKLPIIALFVMVMMVNYQEIKMFFLSKNYLTFLKRILFAFCTSLLLMELVLVPYFIKVKYFSIANREELVLSIDNLDLGRVGRSGIYYTFKGKKHYRGVDGKMVYDIKKNGKYNYCIHLIVNKSIDDIYVINTFEIIKCN